MREIFSDYWKQPWSTNLKKSDQPIYFRRFRKRLCAIELHAPTIPSPAPLKVHRRTLLVEFPDLMWFGDDRRHFFQTALDHYWEFVWRLFRLFHWDAPHSYLIHLKIPTFCSNIVKFWESFITVRKCSHKIFIPTQKCNYFRFRPLDFDWDPAFCLPHRFLLPRIIYLARVVDKEFRYSYVYFFADAASGEKNTVTQLRKHSLALHFCRFRRYLRKLTVEKIEFLH